MNKYYVSIQYDFGSCVYTNYKAKNEDELREKIARDKAKLLFIVNMKEE